MNKPPKKCIVHPLVLLSVADHFERSGQAGNKRVAGVLLGYANKDGSLEVTNSYAVPFEEDRKDQNIWFFDNKYHEKMHDMFLKLSAKEKAVGWYSSGPKLRKSDVEITKMFRKYCQDPILLVSAPPSENKPVSVEIFSLANPTEENTGTNTFLNLTSIVSASDPEEIGIEQLLRDIRDKTISTLSENLRSKKSSLKNFERNLNNIRAYLDKVERKELPKNNKIMFLLQEIFNDSLQMEKTREFIDEYTLKSNDSALILYLAALSRSVLSFADLVDNRVANRATAKKLLEEESKKEEGEKVEKEKKEEKTVNSELEDEDSLSGLSEEYTD